MALMRGGESVLPVTIDIDEQYSIPTKNPPRLHVVHRIDPGRASYSFRDASFRLVLTDDGPRDPV